MSDVTERRKRCFLYFVEGMNGLTEGGIARAGLEYAVTRHASYGQVQTGPGKAGGLIIAPWNGVPDEEQDKGIRVSMEGVDWYRKKTSPEPPSKGDPPGVWVGIVKGHAPGPEDLVLGEGCDLNIPIVLGDGERWFLPVGKPASLVKTLPRCYGIDREGNDLVEVLPGYTAVEKLAEDVYASVSAGKGLGMTESEVVTAASLCLAVNYRVSETECRALRLWTHSSLQTALLVLIDYWTWSTSASAEKNAGETVEEISGG